MAQQIIYIEGKGFIPIQSGQSVQEAIAAADSGGSRTETTPQPQTEKPSGARGAVGAVLDAGVGAAKGLGESAFNLGRIAKGIPLVPGLPQVTGMDATVGGLGNALAELVYGPSGQTADQAFSEVPPELEAQGTGEKVGKTLEQVIEFLLPAGKVGPLGRLSADVVGSTPKAAGAVRRGLSNLAWKGAPIADDAFGAAGVAALHGDESPQSAAAWSAGGGVGGQALSQIARLLATPFGQQLGPYLAALAAMNAGGGLTQTGVGAGLTGFGLAKAAAQHAITRPGGVGKIRWAAEDLGQRGGTLAAGMADQARTPRRRSEQ